MDIKRETTYTLTLTEKELAVLVAGLGCSYTADRVEFANKSFNIDTNSIESDDDDKLYNDLYRVIKNQ